jgi:hypothetical protein
MRGGTGYTVAGEWEGWGTNLGFRAVDGAVDDEQFSTESEQTSIKSRPIHRVRKHDDDLPESNKMKPILTIGGIVYMQRSDDAALREFFLVCI